MVKISLLAKTINLPDILRDVVKYVLTVINYIQVGWTKLFHKWWNKNGNRKYPKVGHNYKIWGTHNMT